MTDRIAISGTEYPHRPIRELLDVAGQLQVRNLELWLPHNFAMEDLSVVEKELTRRDLRAVVISTWTQLNLPGNVQARQELIKQSIFAAKRLGAGSVNTYFGANPSRSVEEAVQQYKRNIAPCIEEADKAGIDMTLENEFEVTGTDPTRRAQVVLKIAEMVGSPRFKINYDPCNFYFAGEEGYPYAYNLLKKHIGYVHLKNGMKYDPAVHPFPPQEFLWRDKSGDYVCCPLGEGAVNVASLLRQLSSNGYEGYLCLEPHVPPDLLVETFRDGVEYLRTNLSGAQEPPAKRIASKAVEVRT
jgi:sugar phosphate isomerase/epimerase